MAKKKQLVWQESDGSYLLSVPGKGRTTIVVSEDKERRVLPWIVTEHYDDGTNQVWFNHCYRTAELAKNEVETTLENIGE